MSKTKLLLKKKYQLEHPLIMAAPRHYLWVTELSTETKFGDVDGGCLRAVWYKLQGIPKSNPMSARSWRIVTLGKAAEKFEQEIDKLMGIYVAGNFKFYDNDLNVSGEVDEVAKIDGEYWLIEYKTYYGTFARRQIKVAPKRAHLLQVLPYLKYFIIDKRLKAFRVEGVKVIYINRADPRDSNNFEHDVTLGRTKSGLDAWPICNGKEYTELSLRAIKRREIKFYWYLDGHKLPPRDFTDSHWLCKSYCDFRDRCKGDGKATCIKGRDKK